MDNKKEGENTGKFEDNYVKNAKLVLKIIEARKGKIKSPHEAENNKER